MGLIKDITSVLKEKAKEEVRNYLKKLSEEEEKAKKAKEEEKKIPSTPPRTENEVEEQPEIIDKEKSNEERKSEEKIKEVKPPMAEELPKEKKPEEKWIPAIVSKSIVKLNIDKSLQDIVISRSFAGDLKALSTEEFSLYMKLYFYTYQLKKNYGYLGNALKKKLNLNSEEIENFDKVINWLQKRGLLFSDKISATQTIYILYIPFDEEFMKKVEEKKKKTAEKKKSSTREKSSPPGVASLGMDDDSLAKSYRTFVSLEVDKAKMRIGRSNFDKIYMEAVKYIDKKHGFKVLSDNELLKEYLTDYYISAFDIPTFEEWKKKFVKG